MKRHFAAFNGVSHGDFFVSVHRAVDDGVEVESVWLESRFGGEYCRVVDDEFHAKLVLLNGGKVVSCGFVYSLSVDGKYLKRRRVTE